MGVFIDFPQTLLGRPDLISFDRRHTSIFEAFGADQPQNLLIVINQEELFIKLKGFTHIQHAEEFTYDFYGIFGKEVKRKKQKRNTYFQE